MRREGVEGSISGEGAKASMGGDGVKTNMGGQGVEADLTDSALLSDKLCDPSIFGDESRTKVCPGIHHTLFRNIQFSAGFDFATDYSFFIHSRISHLLPGCCWANPTWTVSSDGVIRDNRYTLLTTTHVCHPCSSLQYYQPLQKVFNQVATKTYDPVARM